MIEKPPRGVYCECGDSPRRRLPEGNASGGSPPARLRMTIDGSCGMWYNNRKCSGRWCVWQDRLISETQKR